MTPALALGVGATRIANVVPRGATRDAETAAGGGAARRRRRRPSVAMRASGASASSSSSSFAEPSPSPSSPSDPYPRLAVFDLDACFWNEEMYTLRHLVDASAEQVVGELGDSGLEGVVGARSGADVVIRIHPGAMRALQRFHAGEYPGMRIAAASSADTPLAVRIGRSALDVLEIFPGVTAREAFSIGWPAGFEGNLQIGRTPPLSSDKAATHFPILRRETGIAYDEMLFFDDCTWGDHCGAVARGCVEARSGEGPVVVRTPRGLGIDEWELGLERFRQRVEARAEGATRR
jgi:magnesium-dependent phosphatase 1